MLILHTVEIRDTDSQTSTQHKKQSELPKSFIITFNFILTISTFEPNTQCAGFAIVVNCMHLYLQSNFVCINQYAT